MNRSIASFLVLVGVLAGCQFTVGAATAVGGNGRIGTAVTLDPETGQTDTSLSGTISVP